MKTIKYTLFIIAIMLSYSCSDNPSGPDEIDVSPSEGVLNVTGELQAQHEGVSQYVGLRSEGGDFINLTLHITEFPIGSGEVNDFSFDIRMVGNEGPFSLETGEYELGNSGEFTTISSYSNRIVSDDVVIYSTTPNSNGTITIVSIGSESIKATFDVTLHIRDSEESVNITGELNADCLAAGTGFGC